MSVILSVNNEMHRRLSLRRVYISLVQRWNPSVPGRATQHALDDIEAMFSC